MLALPRQHLLAAALAAAFGSTFLLCSPPARAQTSGQAAARVFDVNVPTQALATALNELSRQTGIQVFAAGDVVAGVSSRAVAGKLTLEQALQAMLAGTALEAGNTANGGHAVRRAVQPKAVESTLPLISVTAQADAQNPAGPVKGYVAKRSTAGTKTDTPLVETPQSVSILTADRLEALGATTTRDALAYVPGVNIAPYGSESRYDSALVIRGFNTYAPGYYLDGLALRNTGVNFGIWQTENYNTERLEIMRGPASVLYGQNTPGGMVNVVSKRPRAEPLHEIQVQLGDQSRRQVAADFTGPLDQEGKLLYRISGLVRNAELPAAGMPDDRVAIAPTLTWRPSGDTSLTVFSNFIQMRSGVFYRGWPTRGTLLPNPNGRIAISAFAGEPDFDRQRQDQWTLGYALEHRVNDTWTVRQNLRYGQLDLKLKHVWPTGSFVTVNAANPSDPANFRSVNRMIFTSKEDINTLALDNQAQAVFNAANVQHTVLFGLDYQRGHFDQVSAMGGTVAPIDIFTPTYGAALALPTAPYANSVVGLKQTGLYAQDQIKFNERWIATLGGRYDSAKGTTNNRLSSQTVSQTDDKFTGRAGLVYLHPDGLAPYVSYSESFLPVTTIDPVTGKAFSPETGRQYEAGIRYQPPGRADIYSAAVYDLRRRNYITYNNAVLPVVPTQTGEVTSRGLELEALLQPLPGANLTVAYSWTPKAEVTKSSRISQIGKQLNSVSEQQLSIWGDYRFGNALKLGAGARYIGANKGYNEAAVAKVPAYTLVDAMLSYDIGHWNLALHLRNLTNKTYIASCDVGNCYLGDPRRVNATANYRW